MARLSVVLFVVAVGLPGWGQTYKIVYAFTGKHSSNAGSVIARDKAGNFYGASTYGSVRQCTQGPCGAIYKIDAKGKESTLYKFKGPPDGANPVGVTVDKTGAIYGVTEFGGTSTSSYCGGGCGTVFSLTSSGTETVLHSFSGPPEDGIMPQAGVLVESRDSGSNVVLYGTTTYGGPNSAYDNPGEGTVYKIENGVESLVYSFTGYDDGALPSAGLMLRGGTLYGTAEFGGDGPCVTVLGDGCGTAFALKGSSENALYQFQDGADGADPAAKLIADEAGNFYGTTVLGGDLNCNMSPGNPPGCGVVFKVTSDGVESVLHTFTGGADGAWPSAALVRDAKGNLYGTAELGGDPDCGCGTVFEIDAAGTFSVLHTFEESDGSYPHGLILSHGKLYGVADGGPYGYGVLYELTK